MNTLRKPYVPESHQLTQIEKLLHLPEGEIDHLVKANKNYNETQQRLLNEKVSRMKKQALGILEILYPKIFISIPHRTFTGFRMDSKNEVLSHDAWAVIRNGVNKIHIKFEPRTWKQEIVSEYSKLPIQSHIYYMFLYMHEYGHLLFEKYVGGDLSDDISRPARALDEGFAQMLCFTTGKKLLDLSEQIGLTEEEQASLRNYLTSAFHDFRAYAKNKRKKQASFHDRAYSEGVLYFFHDLFRCHSESGIIEVLENLDTQKLISMTRRSIQYREILHTPDYKDRFRPFLKDPAKFSWE